MLICYRNTVINTFCVRRHAGLFVLLRPRGLEVGRGGAERRALQAAAARPGRAAGAPSSHLPPCRVMLRLPLLLLQSPVQQSSLLLPGDHRHSAQIYEATLAVNLASASASPAHPRATAAAAGGWLWLAGWPCHATGHGQWPGDKNNCLHLHARREGGGQASRCGCRHSTTAACSRPRSLVRFEGDDTGGRRPGRWRRAGAGQLRLRLEWLDAAWPGPPGRRNDTGRSSFATSSSLCSC